MKRTFPVLFTLFFVFLGTVFSQTAIIVGGLSAPVTVSRDARANPYIEAKTDADLYFAQGYVMAGDRLWQMDLMRRVGRGETAELFGKLTLEEDRRWRRFNFAKVAEENLKFLSPDLVAALESYSAGVNAYIASLTPETMPVEFRLLQYAPRDWKPADTIVVGKIMSDSLSSTWHNDLLRASLQKLPPEKLADLTDQVTPYDVLLFGKDVTAERSVAQRPAGNVSDRLLAMADEQVEARRRSLEKIGLYAEELAASNNWVISGKRTADGRPILANDPHLAPSAPGIWYLIHLSAPTMRVAGVTLPGVPGVVLGHNENIAWGATNVGPDVQDLYIETFDTKGKYKTPAGWETPVVRREAINVRKNLMSPETESVPYDVTETRNGPIVLEEGGKRYALKWTAFDPHTNEFEAFFRANRAKNWNDFKAGLRTYGGAAQNFVYADRKGNIGWYAASKIPIRREGDGALPYDGSTDDGDWTGFIPFEELPSLYNPPSGLIVTANQRIVGTSYKYTQMSRDAASPWRARRIFDELEAKRKATFDSVRDVQYDTLNIPVSNLAKAIVKMNAASNKTVTVLKAWDGRMTADSHRALLANEIRNCVADRIAADNRPVPSYLIRERVLDRALRENLIRWLPSGVASYAELLKGCDASTRASLSGKDRFGPDETKWTWGRVWRSRFPHPLAQVPLIGMQFAAPAVPIDGSGQTPNVGSSVSMRHITSPGNWDATRFVIPLGESGDPTSAHFKDQFDAWSTGAPAIFPFSASAVEKARASRITLTPKN
ncbi:MAG: penicillin acylase family protein [Pyrinomonadaceae bacterium]|nr:penicillin acylase family protein [Pyrinomonadaceae bacterium]